jgi:hypothetical protein
MEREAFRILVRDLAGKSLDEARMMNVEVDADFSTRDFDGLILCLRKPRDLPQEYRIPESAQFEGDSIALRQRVQVAVRKFSRG